MKSNRSATDTIHRKCVIEKICCQISRERLARLALFLRETARNLRAHYHTGAGNVSFVRAETRAFGSREI